MKTGRYARVVARALPSKLELSTHMLDFGDRGTRDSVHNSEGRIRSCIIRDGVCHEKSCAQSNPVNCTLAAGN